MRTFKHHFHAVLPVLMQWVACTPYRIIIKEPTLTCWTGNHDRTKGRKDNWKRRKTLLCDRAQAFLVG